MRAFIWSVIANVEVKLLLSLGGVDRIERNIGFRITRRSTLVGR